MPQEIEHPWDWEPVRLVNRMLGSDRLIIDVRSVCKHASIELI